MSVLDVLRWLPLSLESTAKAQTVNNEVISVGYPCPICRKRVSVLCSSDPPKSCCYLIDTKCDCGFERTVCVWELQEMEIWRESNSQQTALTRHNR